MARKNAKPLKPSAPSTTKDVGRTEKKPKKPTDGEELAPSGVYGRILKLLAVVAAMAVTYYFRQLDSEAARFARYIPRKDVTDRLRLNVTCVSSRVRV